MGDTSTRWHVLLCGARRHILPPQHDFRGVVAGIVAVVAVIVAVVAGVVAVAAVIVVVGVVVFDVERESRSCRGSAVSRARSAPIAAVFASARFSQTSLVAEPTPSWFQGAYSWGP